jgi:predicted nucleotidyltransferase
MMFGLSERAINKLNSVFAQHPSIEKAMLFGSRAKGNYKKGSDIDLSLVGNISFKEFLRINNEIDDLLLPWIVDLSLFSHIKNEALIAHINRIGCVFYPERESLKTSVFRDLPIETAFAERFSEQMQGRRKN